MISSHPSFVAPSNRDVPLWRYMDLAKFIWMVQRSCLYFPRLDKLDDPFEGYHTRQDIEAMREHFEHQNIKFVELLRAGSLMLRPTLFVSCWHLNERESAAMWKLYTSHHQAVCVKTTFQRLAEALPPQCMLGEVKYIDYDRDIIPPGNFFNYVTRKRLSFAHEREIRAVLWEPKMKTDENGNSSFIVSGDAGRSVAVDLGSLVTEVLVSPDADDLLYDVVATICDREGLEVAVQRSGVRDRPMY